MEQHAQSSKNSFLDTINSPKELKKLKKEDWQSLLKELEIKDERLLNLTPATYIGLANKLAKL